jgi:type IV pilus assembly protein PilF
MRLERALAMLVALVLAACSTGSTRERSAQPGAKRSSAAEVNVSLGQAYMQQGKNDIAMEKLLRALELDPRYAPGHTVIAVLYERLGDATRAAEHYQRATELAPRSGDTNNNYGTFLCGQQRYAEADRYFERALADPFYGTPAVAWANRGSCALRAGREDDAEQALRRAAQYDPKMPEPLYLLADILHRKGDHFHARAFVQRYEGSGQATAESLLLAMRIEQALGNARGVREYRNRILAEFPDSEQAQNLTDARSGQ